MPSTNLEQMVLELINEARMDPMGAAARYITSYSPLTSNQANIQNNFNFWGTNGATLLAQFQALTPVQPIAFNDNLATAARQHNAAMIAANQQSHQLPGEPAFDVRMTNAGYALNGPAAENIFSAGQDPLHIQAALFVDWGPGGIQSPPGHRNTIMSASFREVGVGITETAVQSNVGPLAVTQDFGTRGNAGAFVLGVAYNDNDGNKFYSMGEGLGTLSVSALGGASTATGASGGYSLLTNQIGAQHITFTGAGLASAVDFSVTLANGQNVKVDIVGGNTLRTSVSGTVTGPISRIEGLGLTGLTLKGDAGSQTLVGTKGNDTLDGGPGGGAAFSFGLNGAADMIADFNGDGRSDVLQIEATGRLAVFRSTGSALTAFEQWGTGGRPTDKLGDFNGDGRTDVIQMWDPSHTAYVWTSTGTAFNAATAWGFGFTSSDKVGDFNGDGRDDVIQLYDGNHQAYVWLSNGTSFNPFSVWGSGVASTDKVGDFNGDGRDDLIQLYDGNHQAYVWLSNGTSFNPFMVWGGGVASTDKIGDVNGDGRDDLIQLYDGNHQAYVWLSNGTSFNPFSVWGSGVSSSDQIGDFNGDGRDDLIQLYGANAYVWLSTGTGFGNFSVWGSGVTPNDTIGDFNADGRDDLIQLGSHGVAYVWLSTGTAFQQYQVWGTGVPEAAASSDRFVFTGAFGRDIVLGFDAGPAVADVIELDDAQFANFAAVLTRTADDGLGNTVITLDASNTITLMGVLKAQLAANDFAFV